MPADPPSRSQVPRQPVASPGASASPPSRAQRTTQYTRYRPPGRRGGDESELGG